jgi:hypothetical protein
VFPADRGEPAAVSGAARRGVAAAAGQRSEGRPTSVKSRHHGQAPRSVAARTAQGYVALANRLPDVALRAFDAALAAQSVVRGGARRRGHASSRSRRRPTR